jgi:hypothetical protein
MTSRFMNDPMKILVKRDELTLEGIRQYVVSVEKEVSYHCNIIVTLITTILLFNIDLLLN